MNNKDITVLNDYNLGCIEGYSTAEEGKLLEDVLPNIECVARRNGIREGFRKYLSEASSAVGEAVKAYHKEPTIDSFVNVFKSLESHHTYDSRYLKCLGIFSRKVKISDALGDTIEYWLNRLLAEELQAWYQYFVSYKFLTGDERAHVQEKFEDYANDELDDHAKSVLNRMHEYGFSITWLSGDPASWCDYSNSEYINPGIDVKTALDVMLNSENEAINSYTQAVEFALSIDDHVSADLFKRILAEEQAHYAELLQFIKDLS